MVTVNDVIFYILDAIIFVMLFRMKRDSDQIEIHTKLGQRWVIPAVFWAIAVVGIFHYTGVFLYVQTAALIAMGILYFMMDSGLSRRGIVMIGRLYPYEKLRKIQVDDAHHCVNFAKNGGMAPITFRPEQMREVRNYLSRYAGIAKHDVRTRPRDTRR